MKDEILEQIDKLKIMVMLDKSIPSEVDRFKEWVDHELHGRFDKNDPPFIFRNDKYIKFQNLVALVAQLYHEENFESEEYQKNRKDIKRLIAEIIAMNMYVQEQTCSCPCCKWPRGMEYGTWGYWSMRHRKEICHCR